MEKENICNKNQQETEKIININDRLDVKNKEHYCIKNDNSKSYGENSLFPPLTTSFLTNITTNTQQSRLRNYPQENIHLLESFSSISKEIKKRFGNKNINITNSYIIEFCNLSQNFRKSGILTKEGFKKLESLIGRTINHEIILGKLIKNTILNLSHSKSLAEFIGILITKGNIIEEFSLRISVSGICKDQLFLDYLKKIFYKIFSLDEERILPQYSSNKLSAIRINSIVIIYALEKLGVISPNQNQRSFSIPQWIFNQNDYMVSCLKGMFEIGGNIVINSRSSLELRFIRPKEYIVKYFEKLCYLLNIKTSNISSFQREVNSTKKYLTLKYYLSIARKSQVKKFLNLIPTLKWELSRNRIQSKLKERNLTLNEVLEFRYNYDRKDKILRQYPFEYNLNSLNNISNLNLKQKLLNLFNIIENGCFDHNIFRSGNPRCSLFRIKGSQENKLFNHHLSPFEEDLTKNNIVIDDSFVGQKLTMLVNQAEHFYQHQLNVFSLKHNITHFFLQNYVSNNEENNFIFNYILAIELLLWTEINTNRFGFNYVTGHADFLLYCNNTFYLCDYKPEEISFLPTIPQVSMYGILFDKFINLNDINIRCITFNKKCSWEYSPSIFFTHIPLIIKNLQNQGFPIDPIWQKCFSNDYKTFFINIL